MAENGAEAVDRCQTQSFDVILMDMQMPVMDGLTATRAIRAERGPNQQTPIVALSANAMDHHRKAWTDVGVEDFLAKPIDPETLITTLAYKASGHASAISEVA
jgi:CheY-like chemotaxis protein